VVAALADELGVPLLPWQSYVLDDALQILPNGNWARSKCGVLVARQNGKTHMMRMRILAGLYIFGEKNAIAMSQTRQLSLDTFKQTVDMAESLDWMRKRIKRVSRTNGQEELEVYCHHYPKTVLQKCERIRKYSIRAATSEGPRGSSADLLYVDELREIDEATWAAVTPITRARPNAQVFWTSNAGDLTSDVLNEQRQRALTFKSDRMGYYEYSAEPGSAVDDIEGWKHANPALKLHNQHPKH
jgi:phage terminase large subunit-like protein